ncbi:hypothetical protein D3C71_1421110 [compost metagenome]
MPMTLRPGTTATRAESADMERAISSERPMTREDLTPGAGSNSYSVTTGPGRTSMISPLMPKSSSTLSRSPALCSSASGVMVVVCWTRASCRRSMEGYSYSPSAKTGASRNIGCEAWMGARGVKRGSAAIFSTG